MRNIQDPNAVVGSLKGGKSTDPFGSEISSILEIEERIFESLFHWNEYYTNVIREGDIDQFKKKIQPKISEWVTIIQNRFFAEINTLKIEEEEEEEEEEEKKKTGEYLVEQLELISDAVVRATLLLVDPNLAVVVRRKTNDGTLVVEERPTIFLDRVDVTKFEHAIVELSNTLENVEEHEIESIIKNITLPSQDTYTKYNFG